METIRAVVNAYASGKIKLGSIPNSTNAKKIRYAPSFFPEGLDPNVRAYPYTSETIAKFLGWNLNRVKRSIVVLAGIENKIKLP